MKNLFLSILLGSLLSPAAFASICDKYFPCGNFEGAMTTSTGELEGHEHAEFKAGPEANALVLSGWLRSPDGTLAWQYSFKLKFGTDGSFTIGPMNSSEVFGSGFCDGSLCSYALRPSDDLSTTGSFTLVGDTLYRSHANKNEDGTFTLNISAMKRQK